MPFSQQLGYNQYHVILFSPLCKNLWKTTKQVVIKQLLRFLVTHILRNQWLEI